MQKTHTDLYRNGCRKSCCNGFVCECCSINKTSALENAETSAVGRALSFAGFGGTEFIASAEEMIKVAIDAAPKPKPKIYLKVEKNLRECKNIAELQQAWLAMSPEERVALESVKDEVKKGLK